MASSAGTVYVKIAYDPISEKEMASDMATSLRQLADYLDAYEQRPRRDEADE